MKRRQKLVEYLLIILLVLAIGALLTAAYLFWDCQLPHFLPATCV